MINILSIDIGIHHLGLSMSSLNDDYTFSEIQWTDMIDITVFKHKNVCMDECKLQHSKTYTDWINHVIQENNFFFEKADIVLIERQPPNGFNAIEQLLFSAFREKSYLIHPRNVHSFLGIGSFDYEQRKVYSIKTCSKYLNDEMKDHIQNMERSHDIADSICRMLYWSAKKNKEWKYKQRKDLCENEYKDIFKKLDSYRYIRNIRIKK